MGDLLEMSTKELDRYTILQKVLAKELTQKKAANLLCISDRQIRNLLKQFSNEGAKGIISKRRGKPSNRQKDHLFKEKVLTLIQEKYPDFGPTFAREKLEELHGLRLSTETLRIWMIESHLWIPRVKKKKVHLPRARRRCFGELIQADGSFHHWFGEEMPALNLTVFIDDATGTLTALFFSKRETTSAYFEALEQHLLKYGRPRGLYTDRYAVFQTAVGNGTTQMQRALQNLEVELILANSPQAKGRVERSNRTLQDRFLKELRLKGIKTIEEANRYAHEFMEIYNTKFSKKPMSDFDAHRPLDGYDLDRVLSHYESRTLLSDLTFQYNNKFFLIQNLCEVRRAKGKKIEIRVSKKGQLRVFMGNKELEFRPLDQVIEKPPVLTRKEVIAWRPRAKRQPPSHPWKRYGYQLTSKNNLNKREEKYR